MKHLNFNLRELVKVRKSDVGRIIYFQAFEPTGRHALLLEVDPVNAAKPRKARVFDWVEKKIVTIFVHEIYDMGSMVDFASIVKRQLSSGEICVSYGEDEIPEKTPAQKAMKLIKTLREAHKSAGKSTLRFK